MMCTVTYTQSEMKTNNLLLPLSESNILTTTLFSNILSMFYWQRVKEYLVTFVSHSNTLLNTLQHYCNNSSNAIAFLNLYAYRISLCLKEKNLLKLKDCF